jgi:hypothetical protein
MVGVQLRRAFRSTTPRRALHRNWRDAVLLLLLMVVMMMGMLAVLDEAFLLLLTRLVIPCVLNRW